MIAGLVGDPRLTGRRAEELLLRLLDRVNALALFARLALLLLARVLGLFSSSDFLPSVGIVFILLWIQIGFRL
jgi:hypothetical protein